MSTTTGSCNRHEKCTARPGFPELKQIQRRQTVQLEQANPVSEWEDYTDPPEGVQHGETVFLRGSVQEGLKHNVYKHEL